MKKNLVLSLLFMLAVAGVSVGTYQYHQQTQQPPSGFPPMTIVQVDISDVQITTVGLVTAGAVFVGTLYLAVLAIRFLWRKAQYSEAE